MYRPSVLVHSGIVKTIVASDGSKSVMLGKYNLVRWRAARSNSPNDSGAQIINDYEAFKCAMHSRANR